MTINAELYRRTGDEDFVNYIKALIVGPPKSGKTVLLSTVPNILICDTEPFANNLESIRHLDVPYVTITNSNDLRDVALTLGNDTMRKRLAQSRYGISDIEGVAIDTLDTLQKLLKKERMAEQRSRTFERDDWGWLKTEMEAIVELFTNLPMHVLLTCHLKTQEIGKGKDAYTQVMPGLEGAIAASIAGMVGYSMMTYREEDVDMATGEITTRYYLKTEGDRNHDFLGTRTGIRGLPTVIEPNIGTIYGKIMEGREEVREQRRKIAEANGAPPPAPPEQPTLPTEQVAQTVSQGDPVQTPVDTPPAPESPPSPPAAEARPSDEELVNPAALGHIKKVYDALEVGFPQETIQVLTMGQARGIATMWRAIQQDHAEGKAPEGLTPQQEMLNYLNGQGWGPPAGNPERQPVRRDEREITHLRANATIDEIKTYIGNPPNLARVQEAYDRELVQDRPRSTLLAKLLDLGAKPPAPQTPVENTPEAPPEAVTPPSPRVDTPSTEDAATEAAVQVLQEGLGAAVVSTAIPKGAPCDVCGNPIDDEDLAELGKKRYNKTLCVKDYLAEQGK